MESRRCQRLDLKVIQVDNEPVSLFGLLEGDLRAIGTIRNTFRDLPAPDGIRYCLSVGSAYPQEGCMVGRRTCAPAPT